MIFSELPDLKLSGRGIVFALIALFTLFALVGCSSIEPMTKTVGNDVLATTGGLDLRYYISTDVTLVNRDTVVSTADRGVRVTERLTRKEIRLKKKTTGRLQNGDIDGILNVAFEQRGGTYPTLAFIQSKGTGPSDKFYFLWQTDPATKEQYIEYEGGKYVISYKGREEPFLQYQRTAKEKKQSRRMRGVR